MENFRLDRTKLHISQMDVQESSPAYWKTCSAEKAIAAIQFLRLQFHPELNDSTTRLQRVYRITQREKN